MLVVIARPVLEQVARLALEAVAIEWKAQGHNLTGKALQELETRIVEQGDSVKIEGYVLDYMANLNTGVPASRIPYNPGSGARSSQYIAGLVDYVQKRMGKSGREAQSIAFAIASRQKREGMPTRNSAKFSSTGKRTGFVEIALDKVEPKLAELVQRAVEAAFELTIESFLKTQLNR